MSEKNKSIITPGIIEYNILTNVKISDTLEKVVNFLRERHQEGDGTLLKQNLHENYIEVVVKIPKKLFYDNSVK
jgi:hypothetical protein